MTGPAGLDEAAMAWLARAEAAAESLRALRRRLLDLHAELSALRSSLGAADEERPSDARPSPEGFPAPAEATAQAAVTRLGDESVAQDVPETTPFVWPAGRAPN